MSFIVREELFFAFYHHRKNVLRLFAPLFAMTT